MLDLRVTLKAGTYKKATRRFATKQFPHKSFLCTDVFTFSNMDKIKKWTFPHFQKMTKIGVSIIVSIPLCPAVWNTNDDKILETGHNQETFPHFQKIDKIKICGYVSI